MILSGHLNRIKIRPPIKASLFERIFWNILRKRGNINYERRQYSRLFVNDDNARVKFKSVSQAIAFIYFVDNLYHFQSTYIFPILIDKYASFVIEILKQNISSVFKHVNET